MLEPPRCGLRLRKGEAYRLPAYRLVGEASFLLSIVCKTIRARSMFESRSVSSNVAQEGGGVVWLFVLVVAARSALVARTLSSALLIFFVCNGSLIK